MNNILMTRDDVVQYVKARLGYPCIDLELETEEKGGLGHIHLSINDCLDWMFRHSQDEADYHDFDVDGIISVVPDKRR